MPRSRNPVFKKRVRGGQSFCAGGFPSSLNAQLPSIKVTINGRTANALLDTGCSKSIVAERFAPKDQRRPLHQGITMMNGEKVSVRFSWDCEVGLGGFSIDLNCLVSCLLPGFDLLLGMDAIEKMGGVTVTADGKVRGFDVCGVSKSGSEDFLHVSDKDFTADFSNGSWCVSWRWIDQKSTPKLRNNVAQYRMDESVEEAFSEEVDRWIERGWLRPFSGEHDGIIPMLAVVQPNKDKVRPVMDFRELNDYVSSHTGQSVVCGEKLREWRRLGTSVKLIDLKSAYLQVLVDESLWRFQVVRYKGTTFCLTRLGFGLNVAPKIMTAIVNKVLSMDPLIKSATSSYIDDIIVNENIAAAEDVVALLHRYGLEAKFPVSLEGARVLGLKVFESEGKLMWTRDNALVEPHPAMTKRELFSFCGKLIGHFPVASWLRPACSYLKRLACEGSWEQHVEQRVLDLSVEVWKRVQAKDPVRGTWNVEDASCGRVWCDASGIAIGICLELEGNIVEDASWLRKSGDASHINLAELDAIVKGVNLAVAWNVRRLEIMTDSRTVCSWLQMLVTDAKRLRVNGLGETLVRRRLGIVRDIIEECDMCLIPLFVPTSENKADCLTRVPKHWLRSVACVAVEPERSCSRSLIMEAHNAIHCGVDKTEHLARLCHPSVAIPRKEVKEVVRSCRQCATIDPAPVRWEEGKLSVRRNWNRLACDVTHYGTQKFLTLVDSGPSRFAIWKPIAEESARTVVSNFETVFLEFGPPEELLLDNSATFKSELLVAMCQRWGVRIRYRAAYRASGNGIVERHHRTVKRTAARTGMTVLEAVFYYNFLPREGTNAASCPYRRIFRYRRRCPLQPSKPAKVDTRRPPFSAGDRVVVKPPGARCTTPWRVGTVTSVTPDGVIEVDGVHRHVGDIRGLPESSESSGGSDSDSESSGESEGDSADIRREPYCLRDRALLQQPRRFPD